MRGAAMRGLVPMVQEQSIPPFVAVDVVCG